ncbi:AAA family ATPase [Desulfobacterales bacterium HSG16]|nr:AAA family ATPase [Desulfobacterales bacterium HSG16]
MNQNLKKIPYGMAEFGSVQKGQMYYADKTHFIPILESVSRYVFFIRPRRFGKSLWLSVLQYYYDINEKDNFDKIFQDTYILRHPTSERHTYLIMTFNFAMVNSDVRYLEESFEQYGKSIIDDFFERYPLYFDEKERLKIQSCSRTEHQLKELFLLMSRKPLKIYLFIDEYDNFANNVLTDAGKTAYQDLTRGQGFFRFFFNLLKNATSVKGSGLDKLFITGVSPVTMDDVTSGFNIGKNISRSNKFGTLLGFSEAEVKKMLDYYSKAGLLKEDPAFYLKIMKIWYNNYRFADKAVESMFNTDMILYFISEMIDEGTLPGDMIDQNIKIDYGKLRHLMLADRQLNGNFSELKRIMEDGRTICNIQISFPSDRLIDQRNFVSLLFYFGLLSIADVRGQQQVLVIPNLTVKKLMYGYIRDAFYDTGIFRIDMWRLADLVYEMAYHGIWQPVTDFMTKEIEEQTSVRNYIEGERTVQMFLLAYLNICDYYIIRTEQEAGKGYADIYLEPFLARFPDMKYGYLIELKYISRSESLATKLEKKLKRIISDATRQLKKYADDELMKKRSEGYTLKKLILVYQGWELIYSSEVI